MTTGPMTTGFVDATSISDIDVSDLDLSEVQAAWERQLDSLLDAWFGITADQRRQIEAQVRLAVHADDVAALAQMSVSTAAATEALVQAMNDMALRAAEHVVEEARSQGVRIDPVSTDRAMFGPFAAAVAVLLAEGLTNAAGREALRRWSPQATGDEVSQAVTLYLESLSDAFVAANLGGALTMAQNAGRLDTMLAGPSAAIYASEQMDANTCKPCRRINGKWIGNSDDPTIADKVAAIYPNGGYVDCEGGVRCRGTTVSIYRPAGPQARTYKRDKEGQFSSGGGGSPEKLHDDEATIQDTFNYRDEKTGMSAEVTSIRNSGPNQTTYVSVAIKDRTGNVVGAAERMIRPPDQKTVEHGGLAFEDQFQGQGFATRYNQQVEASYRANGIERITTNATLGVGGYAWAKAGYDFRGPGDRAGVATRARETGRKFNPDVQAQIEKVAANPRSSPADFAMIGHTSGASTWPGKQIMLGSTWGGVKEL